MLHWSREDEGWELAHEDWPRPYSVFLLHSEALAFARAVLAADAATPCPEADVMEAG